MSDSEDFSSGEDEDYLPSGEEYSEDDVSELVKEEEVEEQKQQPEWKKCKKDAKGIAPRKRKKKGRAFLRPGGRRVFERQQKRARGRRPGESHRTHGTRTRRGRRRRPCGPASSVTSARNPKPLPQIRLPAARNATPADEKNVCRSQGEPKEPESSKITVTQVFDFAGEEVRVTKEVDAASKEAQLFRKQQEPKGATQASPPTVSGVKRPSGMNSLLGKIGSKKQKMSTLEKSKLDWENFKEEEGIGDELAIHNRGKDGYLERRAFLERVDYRQFEHERDLRLSNMKP